MLNETILCWRLSNLDWKGWPDFFCGNLTTGRPSGSIIVDERLWEIYIYIINESMLTKLTMREGLAAWWSLSKGCGDISIMMDLGLPNIYLFLVKRWLLDIKLTSHAWSEFMPGDLMMASSTAMGDADFMTWSWMDVWMACLNLMHKLALECASDLISPPW